MSPEHTHESTSAAPRSPERRRIAMWLVLSVLAALLAWFGFRAYLSPELLFHFSNAFYC
jgi:cell division protein FtsB